MLLTPVIGYFRAVLQMLVGEIKGSTSEFTTLNPI